MARCNPLNFGTNLFDKLLDKDTIDTIKMVLTHVGIWLSACVYLIVGAGILTAIEFDSSSAVLNQPELDFPTDQIFKDPLDIQSARPTSAPGRPATRPPNISSIANRVDEYLEKKVLQIIRSEKPHAADRKTLEGELPQKIRADLLGLADGDRTKTKKENIVHDWSYPSTFRFAFCLITTIGTGQKAPKTSGGKAFAILFGLIGIPFVMLALADMGKFMIDAAVHAQKRLLECSKQRMANTPAVEVRLLKKLDEKKKKKADGEEKPEMGQETRAMICLLLFFGFFMVFTIWGAPFYNDWGFLNRAYLSFITFATLGFGDIVLDGKEFSLATLLYVVAGLIIITMSVEAAAKAFRQLHHIGATLKDAGSTIIWFGGKSISVNELVGSIGKKAGISEKDIRGWDLNSIVLKTIQEKNKRKGTKAICPEDFKCLMQSGIIIPFVDEDFVGFV